MLRSTRNDTPIGQELNLSDTITPSGAVRLDILETSSTETSTSSSGSEDQTFLGHDNVNTTPSAEEAPAPPPKSVSAPPTKVLFLDGVRGLAAILVVTQHSHEYMQKLNLGAVAVDAFFVLSSFLLTWLFMKRSMKLLVQGASLRSWGFTLVDYFSKRFFRVYPLFALTGIALSFMSFEDQHVYYLVKAPDDFDLLQMLTFDFDHRWFVLWTLPLEISYYFVIPVFVLAILGMRRFWWVAVFPLFAWVVHEGCFSVYLLHSFVVWNPTISAQPKYFNRLFSRFFLIFLLASTTYYLVEYPSQLLAQKISRFLAAWEAKSSDGLTKFTCMEQITFNKQKAHIGVK
ncbi:hypothetical protein BBO99_00009403 [Phytophthora kernoviae]|uniref:Acyltransferase 3 domain-containing protein n=2 Tax=Phytophthora kernoviae TaxID=325452 RepID=A0A3R7JNN6_9STRA|nr:hypothetical protein G195_011037 [Phytophthora kernoviae 00238/432]KAG2504676.1 hypothetical protein JM16_009301 [Phytophthora kernoviae]KAG2507280.1 hypothetical protein JM18_009234 [Phytophthora kernoviae]RLN21148.1 hypothetical protein BBI17_009427 [Phytophthora kernoviae]RLN73444.1 hypothetical protein BBO99_00009403 [Phytophthora kernoviae]